MAKSDTSIPQNFHEWLQGLLPELAKGMACPDSTIRFCQQLSMVVAGKLKQHQQSAVVGVGGAQGGSPVPNLGGGIGGGMGGPPKPPGMQMPGGPAGGGAANPMQPNLSAPNLMQGSPTPTPDELRRVLSQTAGA